MKISIFLVIVFFILSLSSCKQDSWTKEEKSIFLKSCKEEGGSKKYCNCYMEILIQKYPIASEVDKLDYETKVDLAAECENI